MTLKTYDEREILGRLGSLDRRAKTAFAAACAERLLPLFERYAHIAGAPEMAARLGVIVAAAWEVAGGVDRDVAGYQSEAESLVPSDEDGWTLERGYGQNAAAAAAYAIRTWLTDDAQEAAWAARQVYELADYAVLRSKPELDLNGPAGERAVLESEIVQGALAALGRALVAVESAPLTWQELQADTQADSQAWAASLP